MNDEGDGALLTLEPLVDAVREGVENTGWVLSGLQKTTSHEFEGRWAGESTRSAYLFFHRPGDDDRVSVDVFLDETTRGLKGNLALAVDGRLLGQLGRVHELLARLGKAADDCLIEGYRTPITLRLRTDRRASPDGADTECRFKLQIPSTAIAAGVGAVSALSAATVRTFEALLGAQAVVDFLAQPHS